MVSVYEGALREILVTRFGKVRATLQDADTVYVETDPRNYPHRAAVGDGEGGRDAGLCWRGREVYVSAHFSPAGHASVSRFGFEGCEWHPHRVTGVSFVGYPLSSRVSDAAGRAILRELAGAVAVWLRDAGGAREAAGRRERGRRAAECRASAGSLRERAVLLEALAAEHESGGVSDLEVFFARKRELLER